MADKETIFHMVITSNHANVIAHYDYNNYYDQHVMMEGMDIVGGRGLLKTDTIWCDTALEMRTIFVLLF